MYYTSYRVLSSISHGDGGLVIENTSVITCILWNHPQYFYICEDCDFFVRLHKTFGFYKFTELFAPTNFGFDVVDDVFIDVKMVIR